MSQFSRFYGFSCGGLDPSGFYNPFFPYFAGVPELDKASLMTTWLGTNL